VPKPATTRFEGFELDHIYVFTESEASARDICAKHGLVPLWPPMRHVGQGTASIAVGLAGGYLELVWIADPRELREAEKRHGAKLAMRSNWQESNAVPFGIGLRNREASQQVLSPNWRAYSPSWLTSEEPIYLLGSLECPASRPSIFVVPSNITYPRLLQNASSDVHQRIKLQPLHGAILSAPSIQADSLVADLHHTGLNLRSSLTPSLDIPGVVSLVLG